MGFTLYSKHPCAHLNISVMDINSMTVQELKKELRSRGQKVSGKKSELLQRLTAAIEAEEIETSTTHKPEPEPDDNETPQTDFADFEEYINDEYNRLNNHNNDDENKSVNIDDIINHNNNEQENEEEEKQNILTSDFALNETPKESQSDIVIADFCDDSNALNTKSKIETRSNRFGTMESSDSAKIESRKRRFGSMHELNVLPPTKKQRIDPSKERMKIFERAQKFGTALPKSFKLTTEQSALIHADKINRAKRFNTEHLLPSVIKKAEFESKRVERMKRFKTENNANKEVENEMSVNIIPSKVENLNSTTLTERKLRFGTLDKVSQRKEKFGNGKKGKKGFNKQRQFKNKQKFRKFREFKKNNKRQRGNGYNGNYQSAQFNAEEQEKINQRRARFSGM